MGIPRWIRITSAALCWLGLFVGGSLYISPGKFIPDIDFAAPGPHYLVLMWAARQVALAFILGYAVFRGSVPILQAALIAYCLMNVQDAGIGIWRNDVPLIIGAASFTLLSAAMVAALHEKKTGGSAS
jgi:hypothetical protein